MKKLSQKFASVGIKLEEVNENQMEFVGFWKKTKGIRVLKNNEDGTYWVIACKNIGGLNNNQKRTFQMITKMTKIESFELLFASISNNTKGELILFKRPLSFDQLLLIVKKL